MTDSHMKMARMPEGITELLPHLQPDGTPAPFPLLKVRNVFVLPGIPSIVRSKWAAVKAHLLTEFGESSRAFHNRCGALAVVGASVCCSPSLST